MIPLFFVVGSLVPASDSTESMTVGPCPVAMGATVDARNLIQLGMSTDQVRHLLGNPEMLPVGGVNFEEWRYFRLGAEVRFTYGKASSMIRLTREQMSKRWNLSPWREATHSPGGRD